MLSAPVPATVAMTPGRSFDAAERWLFLGRMRWLTAYQESKYSLDTGPLPGQSAAGSIPADRMGHTDLLSGVSYDHRAEVPYRTGRRSRALSAHHRGTSLVMPEAVLADR
jgi:hypothetical protein